MPTETTIDILDAVKLEIELWRKPINPILQTICDPFEENEFGARLMDFGLKMKLTMTEKRGIGLAGPQVGLTKRIFIMGFPDQPGRLTETICNPEIELSGNKWVAKEGCLSLPGIHGLVRRSENVVMKYRTPFGEHKEMVLTHMDGRVAQHEFDHIEGVMFFERMQEKQAAKVLESWFKYPRR